MVEGIRRKEWVDMYRLVRESVCVSRWFLDLQGRIRYVRPVLVRDHLELSPHIRM